CYYCQVCALSLFCFLVRFPCVVTCSSVLCLFTFCLLVSYSSRPWPSLSARLYCFHLSLVIHGVYSVYSCYSLRSRHFRLRVIFIVFLRVPSVPYMLIVYSCFRPRTGQ